MCPLTLCPSFREDVGEHTDVFSSLFISLFLFCMIKQINGDAIINDKIAPASTAFDFNDVVTRDSNGKLAKATGTTPRSQLLGLIQATIASTDEDYASEKPVPVLEFHEGAEFEADVDTGSAVASMREKRFDLNDEDGVNLTSSGQRCFEITRVLSTSKVRGKFITEGDVAELKKFTQTITADDLTDGGGAAGTKILDLNIPAGAVVVRTIVKDIVGFAGDTSAVIQVGDGTDVDRYNTGTPNVFATASAGVDMGAPSGTAFHATAKDVVVTITSDSDITAVITDGSGSIEITVLYYEVA